MCSIALSESIGKFVSPREFIALDEDTLVAEAADMMLQHNIRHLLVVDNSGNNHNNDANAPVGIVTPLDFTRYQGVSCFCV